jgi:GTPase
LGGGIGTRGPGETKLEVDRRRIRQRIRALERSIERVARTRLLHRRQRRHAGVPLVALVGYTNAGKSTLFNALTGADVAVEDRLFATLDPTIRNIRLPHKSVVALSDTVGFVQHLPHSLVAAFMATLEEIRSAQCVIHVVDRHHPGWMAQADAVEQVLVELGIEDTPRVTAFNKIDLMVSDSTGATPVTGDRTRSQGSVPVAVSARTGAGLDDLKVAIEETVCSGVASYLFAVPPERSDVVAQLHARGRVIARRARRGRELIEVELTGDAISHWGEAWAPFLLPVRKRSKRAASVSSA